MIDNGISGLAQRDIEYPPVGMILGQYISVQVQYTVGSRKYK